MTSKIHENKIRSTVIAYIYKYNTVHGMENGKIEDKMPLTLILREHFF